MNKFNSLLLASFFLLIVLFAVVSRVETKNNTVSITAPVNRYVLGEQTVSGNEEEGLEQEVINDNPYAIDYLRSKEFQPSKINILESVETSPNSDFTSYKFSFKVEGLTQYGLLNVPLGRVPQEGFPVVVVAHGHVHPPDYTTEGDYRGISDWYAQNGFLVLKPDYRGHGESEGIADDPLARFNYTIDVLTLLNSLENVKNTDLNNVFLYAHSMGGDITLRVLETSDIVKGATLWAPVTAPYPEGLTYYLLKNYDLDEFESASKFIREIFDVEDYKDLSPIQNLENIDVPIIVQHGTKDDQVPIVWSEDLVDRLHDLNKEATLYKYPGDDHALSLGYWSTAAERDVRFFRSLLQK